MNSNGGGGRGGSSDQTTVPLVPTTGPTHLRPPVARAHEYVPRPRACWTAASAGLRSHTRPLRVSRPPVRATAAATTTVVPAGRPDPRMEPLARRRLGPAVAGQLLQHHDALLAPTSVHGSGLGDGTVPISPCATKFHNSKSKRTKIQLVSGCERIEALTGSGDSALHLPVSGRRCDSRSGDGGGGFRAEVDSGQADGGVERGGRRGLVL
jgi:hypothetical protein